MVLLDRDGVLNRDRPDSVKSPDELVLIPDAAQAVARLNAAGIKAVVVTNQSVVGRGIIDDAMLAAIHAKLHAELAQWGAKLDDVIVCTDAPARATSRRKPKPGMLREALEKFGMQAADCLVIGDSIRDLEAGAAIGCRLILVRTGKGAAAEKAGIPIWLQPVEVRDDLAAATADLLAIRETPKPKRGWRLAAHLGAAVFFAAAGWAVGLVWFMAEIPNHIEDPARHTDAIVVLTGGSERLRAGLDLLAAGAAGRMLISGVHREVTVGDILRLSPDVPASLSCCIDLGYEASDTVGNAAEAAGWMRAQGFQSLRLVTSSYHLPRSLLEFQRVLPDAEIVPHPVIPAAVPTGAWWWRPKTFELIAEEYSKYLLARLRQAFAPRGPARN
jgi:histidinol-phosphate phosphatase family protein